MKINELPYELLVQITNNLNDRDLRALAGTSHFFRNFSQFEFLYRKIRSFKLLPTYLMNILVHLELTEGQLQRFIQLLAAIHYELRQVMSHEHHAEWILYALLDLPNLAQKYLGDQFASITDDSGNAYYHYLALAGHWQAFKQHMSVYHPDFQYDKNDPRCLAISRKAIKGAHCEFYQQLIQEYQFPDYTQDADFAFSLLLSAIASGNLTLVQQLTADRQPLSFDFLAQAIRLGHGHIFDYLTAGDEPLCEIETAEEAAEVFTMAAFFDDLARVKYFLENKDARELLSFNLHTRHNGDTVRTRALMGGSKKVLNYLLEKDPGLLKQRSGQLPSLLLCAEGKQLAMCRYLIDEQRFDPYSCSDKGEYSIHFAALAGDYDGFIWLANRYFPQDKLKATEAGETPLHIAAENGRYWFLRQAFKDFGSKAFLLKTHTQASVLHYACRYANFHLIDLLINNFPLFLHDQDQEGNTPLHHFILHKNPRCTALHEAVISTFVQKFGTEIFYIPNKDKLTAFELLSPETKNIILSYSAIPK